MESKKEALKLRINGILKDIFLPTVMQAAIAKLRPSADEIPGLANTLGCILKEASVPSMWPELDCMQDVIRECQRQWSKSPSVDENEEDEDILSEARNDESNELLRTEYPMLLFYLGSAFPKPFVPKQLKRRLARRCGVLYDPFASLLGAIENPPIEKECVTQIPTTPSKNNLRSKRIRMSEIAARLRNRVILEASSLDTQSRSHTSVPIALQPSRKSRQKDNENVSLTRESRPASDSRMAAKRAPETIIEEETNLTTKKKKRNKTLPATHEPADYSLTPVRVKKEGVEVLEPNNEDYLLYTQQGGVVDVRSLPRTRFGRLVRPVPDLYRDPAVVKETNGSIVLEHGYSFT